MRRSRSRQVPLRDRWNLQKTRRRVDDPGRSGGPVRKIRAAGSVDLGDDHRGHSRIGAEALGDVGDA